MGMSEDARESLESVQEASGEEAKEASGQKMEHRERQPIHKKAGRKDNVIYVGKKPTMSYVLAVITQFSEGNSEVFVKARGRSISTVVDVVEVTKKKFLTDVKCEIETDTEVITDERNQRINVSTISARLFK
jgi:DNA-binding protein